MKEDVYTGALWAQVGTETPSLERENLSTTSLMSTYSSPHINNSIRLDFKKLILSLHLTMDQGYNTAIPYVFEVSIPKINDVD